MNRVMVAEQVVASEPVINAVNTADIDVARVQAQNLKAVTWLESGLAHELNASIQTVNENLRVLEDALAGAMGALAAHQKVTAAVKAMSDPKGVRAAVAAAAEATATEATSNVASFAKQGPAALQQALERMQRVANIAQAMREFA